MATKTDQPAERALVDLAARVRSVHCEQGGDVAAYELSRWALDLAGVVSVLHSWAETVTAEADEVDREQAGADLLSAWKTYLHNREKHTHG